MNLFAWEMVNATFQESLRIDIKQEQVEKLF